MKTKLLLLSLFAYLSLTAQTVAIPDANFEQVLINKGIDSDGIVNGQILSSDAENVTELEIEWEFQVHDLSGIESFTNLETLIVTHSEINSIDVSYNTKLKILNCRSNQLTSIDVSSNILLEELYVGNSYDVGPFNEITQVDLSHNPNIKVFEATNLAGLIEFVNLKNGNNNPEMTIQIGFETPSNATNIVCIQVDNAEQALGNQLPYSEWNIYHIEAEYNFSENCALSTEIPVAANDIFVYPNPVSNILYIQNLNSVVNVQLFDISGRLVREYKNIGSQGMDVSALAKGMYVVKISDGKSGRSQKIIVE